MCTLLGDLTESPGSRFARVGHRPKADSSAPGHREKSGLRGGRRRGSWGRPSAEGIGRWVFGPSPCLCLCLDRTSKGPRPASPVLSALARGVPAAGQLHEGPRPRSARSATAPSPPLGVLGVWTPPDAGLPSQPLSHQLCGLGRAVRPPPLGASENHRPAAWGRVSRDPVQRPAQSSQQVNFLKKV